ncbi:hypothetical protein HALLA_04420 (plasmid) [Halostagnicola larsenii XH-48]|uniref:Uncharacterized protein n=1 Tax=Halostagnicola larsenii XH-48 TaxID=797299 RepID=W0JWN5_9EURY|nr:hypothetical protein HALLA_04420 [Halostagnicola larsenii XH-48]
MDSLSTEIPMLLINLYSIIGDVSNGQFFAVFGVTVNREHNGVRWLTLVWNEQIKRNMNSIFRSNRPFLSFVIGSRFGLELS